MKYYAVKVGKKTGIFLTWEEAKTYVLGYPGAQYKSFPTIELAQAYLYGQRQEKTQNTTRRKIYTDGSCINSIGGYGYVYVKKLDNEKDESYYGKVPGNSTNQVAELYAIYSALKNTLNKEIDLYTDSKYSIGCLTEWYENWQRNGWKNSKGEDVANKELISAILELLKDRDVSFFHVYGHKGDFYNELCDKLANMGRLAENYLIQLGEFI